MSLRDSMPTTAWLVDLARDLCGAGAVNEQIRAGMAGMPNRFHAVENGRTVGTPMTLHSGITLRGMVLLPPVAEAPEPKKAARRGR